MVWIDALIVVWKVSIVMSLSQFWVEIFKNLALLFCIIKRFEKNILKKAA